MLSSGNTIVKRIAALVAAAAATAIFSGCTHAAQLPTAPARPAPAYCHHGYGYMPPAQWHAACDHSERTGS